MPSSAQKSKPFTDRLLMKIDLKELQTKMEEAGFSQEQMEELKQRRRRLQNRQSAKTSAARRQSKYDAIAETNDALRAEIAELQSQNADLMRQADEARRLAQQAVQENAALRQEVASMSSSLLETSTHQANAGQFVFPAGIVPFNVYGGVEGKE
eukprot:m.470962 g.470962  ORF g.470962 m.470962 type:complete len:154 (+) comp30442_c0_seq1:73-534(+)